MGLENLVEQMEKTMVVSDIHGEFVDESAYAIALAYMKDYKPDKVVINGDLGDFYSISDFDKNPDRKTKLVDDKKVMREILYDIRKTAGKACEITLIEGNHENRLQKFLWRNPQLEGLDELYIPKLIGVKDFNVKYVGADREYWKKTMGHLNVGNATITHGDSRLNGVKGGQNASYNTAKQSGRDVIIGHTHRLKMNYFTNFNQSVVGIECGCLCQVPGTADWQQGFVTFETEKGKNYNYRLHNIKNNELKADGATYLIE